MANPVIKTSLLRKIRSLPACLLKLRADLQSLPDHHGRIAHFAMSNPAGFLELDAREIGYQCGTSEATVVRFCQRIGYRGLSEMKMVLARELAANLIASRVTGRFDRENPVLESVFSSCAEALRDTLSGMDQRENRFDRDCDSTQRTALSIWRGRFRAHRASRRTQLPRIWAFKPLPLSIRFNSMPPPNWQPAKMWRSR